MSDKDWMDAQVDKAAESNKSITEKTKSRIKEMLQSSLQERQLPHGETNKLAAVLISDMAPEGTGSTTSKAP